MKYIGELLKGVMIGVANILPGISGGILAISMGVYDTIIHAVTHLLQEPKKSIRVLFPYAAGAAAGIVCLSLTFEFLFRTFPLQTKMAFIGLIGGGLPALFDRVKDRQGDANDRKDVWLTLAAFGAVVAVTYLCKQSLASGSLRENTVNDGTAFLTAGPFWEIRMVLIGILAAATMVIPGVSGSMIMMMLGVYEPILQTTNAWIRASARLDVWGLVYYGSALAPYYIGMGVGVFLFAKLVEHFLGHYERQMYRVVIGLVCSSPVVILWDVAWYGVQPGQLLGAMSLCLFGFILAMNLGGEG